MLGNANAHESPSNCFRGSRLVSIYRWTNCRLLQIYAGLNSADCAYRPIWVRKRENHPPSCHRSFRHSSQTATGKQLEDLLKSELKHCVRLFFVWTSSEFDAIVLSHRTVPRASSIRLDSKSPNTRRQIIGHPTTKNHQPPNQPSHPITRPPDHFSPNPSTDHKMDRPVPLRPKPAAIITSAKKDESYIKLVKNDVDDLFQYFFGIRNWIHYRNGLTMLSRFAYYSLTTLSGLQSLGEEYTNIVMIDGEQLRVPSFKRRLLLVALQSCGQILFEQSLNHLMEILDTPNVNLWPKQSVSFWKTDHEVSIRESFWKTNHQVSIRDSNISFILATMKNVD